jgi:hypothetical protein
MKKKRQFTSRKLEKRCLENVRIMREAKERKYLAELCKYFGVETTDE